MDALGVEVTTFSNLEVALAWEILDLGHEHGSILLVLGVVVLPVVNRDGHDIIHNLLEINLDHPLNILELLPERVKSGMTDLVTLRKVIAQLINCLVYHGLLGLVLLGQAGVDILVLGLDLVHVSVSPGDPASSRPTHRGPLVPCTTAHTSAQFVPEDEELG